MIVPITESSVWQSSLQQVPLLELPDRHTLVIAPHPDDETLGAGALIATLRQNGVPVTVVAATDGENAYETNNAERAVLGKTREREQRDALEILGVDDSMIKRLRLPDSGLASAEQSLTDQILTIVEPDMLILAPWIGDFHPDHEACACAARNAARSKSVPLLSYFFWTWHRGTPDLLADLPLRRFMPERETLNAKAKALSMHRSQLERADGEPILPKRLLEPASWPFEVFVTQ